MPPTCARRHDRRPPHHLTPAQCTARADFFSLELGKEWRSDTEESKTFFQSIKARIEANARAVRHDTITDLSSLLSPVTSTNKRRRLSIEKEETDSEEILEAQDVLDAFYAAVSESDEDVESKLPPPRAPRARKQERIRRPRAPPVSEDQCVRLGWLRLRVDTEYDDDTIIDDGDSVDGSGRHPVTISVIEKLTTIDGSDEVSQLLRFERVQHRVDEPTLKTTPAKSHSVSSSSRSPSPSRKSNTTSASPAATASRPLPPKSKKRRVLIDLPLSDDSEWVEEEREDSDDDRQSSRRSTNSIDDCIVADEPNTIKYIGLPILVHRFSVIQTHRVDNACSDDTLSMVVWLYLKGTLALFAHYDANQQWVHIDCALMPGYITSTPSPTHSLIMHDRDVATKIRSLLEWATNDDFSSESVNVSTDREFNPESIYTAAMPPKSNHQPLIDELHASLTNAGLSTELRPYQLRAVDWMVKRESLALDDSASLEHEIAYHWFECLLPFTVNHPRFGKLRSLWLNTATGALALRPELAEVAIAVRGGILADEMGLGKTVSTLGLVLARPRIDFEPLPSPPPSASTDRMGIDSHIVSCYCGDDSEHSNLDFVQCDGCHRWQHCKCVAFDTSTDRDQPYHCPSCSAASTPLPIKATLVACPDVLLAQWKDEIERHITTDRVRVLIYQGCRAGANSGIKLTPVKSKLSRFAMHRVIIDGNGNGNGHGRGRGDDDDIVMAGSDDESDGNDHGHEPHRPRPIVESYPVYRPVQLARYDIVLVSFSVLRADFAHSKPVDRGLRAKKYRVMPSPLRSTQFWRVVLDEAQMVADGTAAAASMAMTVPSVNRFAVSGTPIVHGIADMQGLLMFLNAAPYSNKHFWKRVIADNYTRNAESQRKMHAIAARLMWRNSKSSVASELSLPPLSSIEHKLTFTPVEAYCYDQCVTEAQVKTDELHRRRVDTRIKLLSTSLLRMRQSCNHPQLGSRSKTLTVRKHALTMQEITEQLLNAARIETEEQQRLMIAAMHGLAGLHFLKFNYEDAINLYCEVLGITAHIATSAGDQFDQEVDTERGRDKGIDRLIAMDKLQECHALFNLAQAASICYDDDFRVSESSRSTQSMSVIRARIAHLYARVDALKAAHVDKAAQVMRAAAEKWVERREEITETEHKMMEEEGADVWFEQFVRLIQHKPGVEATLVRRIKAELAEVNTSADRRGRETASSHSIVDSFSDMRGLAFIVDSHVKELTQSRERLVRKLQKFVDDQPPSAAEINLSVKCARCRIDQNGPACQHCKVETLIRLVESKLFRHVREKGMGSYIRTSNVGDERLIVEGQTRHETNRMLQQAGLADAALSDEDESQAESQSKGAHEVEIALQTCQSFLRNTANDIDDCEILLIGAGLQLALFQSMKKELVSARTFSSTHRDQLSAYDEMAMTCSRLQLMSEDAPSLSSASTSNSSISKKQHGQIMASDIATLFAAFEYDRLTASAGLRDRLSNLHFLQSQLDRENDPASDLCPICQDRRLSKEKEIAVFQCFHRYCSRCVLTLINRAQKSPTLVCPMCRKQQMIKDIAYVSRNKYALPTETQPQSVSEAKQDTTNPSDETSSPPSQSVSPSLPAIMGSWSTKIGSLASLVRKILADDPTAKTLIFSEWLDCLSLIEQCLNDNGISSLTLVQRRHYPAIIARFNTDDSVKCLLLPASRSNHGLNLTAASRVILVEPQLSAAIEHQCIARIYRMGQQHSTAVHRLLIDGSVETRIAAKNAIDAQTSKDSGKEEFGFKGRGNRLEHLSSEEMQRLILASDSSSGDGEEKSHAEDDSSSSSDEANNMYWSAPVNFNGRTMSRLRALTILQRQHNYRQSELDETPASAGSDKDEVSAPTRAPSESFWHSRLVPAPVLQQLLQLPAVAE